MLYRMTSVFKNLLLEIKNTLNLAIEVVKYIIARALNSRILPFGNKCKIFPKTTTSAKFSPVSNQVYS